MDQASFLQERPVEDQAVVEVVLNAWTLGNDDDVVPIIQFGELLEFLSMGRRFQTCPVALGSEVSVFRPDATPQRRRVSKAAMSATVVPSRKSASCPR